MVSSYLLFKIFDLIKNNLSSYVIVQGQEENLYKNLFIAPQPNARDRQFQIKGQSLPFICIWQKSPVELDKDAYARSHTFAEMYA